MLVNGKLDEGDVILDDVDGYLKINFKNLTINVSHKK